MGEERLEDALLRRASEAVESARAIVAGSEVLVDVSAALRNDALTTRCAWCGRYRIGERWLVVAHHEQLVESARATHGICPDCVAALRDAGMSV